MSSIPPPRSPEYLAVGVLQQPGQRRDHVVYVQRRPRLAIAQIAQGPRADLQQRPGSLNVRGLRTLNDGLLHDGSLRSNERNGWEGSRRCLTCERASSSHPKASRLRQHPFCFGLSSRTTVRLETAFVVRWDVNTCWNTHPLMTAGEATGVGGSSGRLLVSRWSRQNSLRTVRAAKEALKDFSCNVAQRMYLAWVKAGPRCDRVCKIGFRDMFPLPLSWLDAQLRPPT